MSDVWLVVGLGNPGPRYAATPHNVGYLVVDELSSRLGGPLRTHKSRRADVLEGRVERDGPRMVLGRARAFMNESGGPIKALVDFYKVPTDRLIVVHDEIDLPFGRIETRLGGGLAGHNGLKSLKRGLGSADFRRVRVGVGRPDTTDPELVSAHVLGRFSEPRAEVDALIDDAVRAVERVIGVGE